MISGFHQRDGEERCARRLSRFAVAERRGSRPAGNADGDPAGRKRPGNVTSQRDPDHKQNRETDATILKVNFIFINERAAAAPAEKEGPR